MGIGAADRTESRNKVRHSLVGEEFALETVPPEATTASYKIGIMLLAANISLPSLVMGGELGVQLAFTETAWACLWAGIILTLLAGTCAYVGAVSRLTTYVLIIQAFGRQGGRVINLLLSLSAIGWFGVVAMLFAHTMVRLVPAMGQTGNLLFWAVSGTILMAFTTVVGFRALNWLSNIMLPAKLGLMVWAVTAAIGAHGAIFMDVRPGTITMDASTAISFIVGGWVVGAVIAPDFSRFARRPVGGALACGLSLGVGYPLVLLAACIPAILTGEKDMVATMEALGMGFSALAIVLLASWSNGASNLYSGALMATTVLPGRRRVTLVWMVGALGLTLGLLGITDRIIPYLILLSTVVPPIAGIYLPRFLIDRWTGMAPPPERDWQPAALISLVVGVAIGALGDRSVPTGIVAVDSLLAAAASYLLFELFRRRTAKA